MNKVYCTLSLRSSTILFQGPLALGLVDGFKGFNLVGSTAMLAETSLLVTAEIVLSTLSWMGCFGVGGLESPRTAIVGRNKDAMTILWLRKEFDIDGLRSQVTCKQQNWYRKCHTTIDGHYFTLWDVASVLTHCFRKISPIISSISLSTIILGSSRSSWTLHIWCWVRGSRAQTVTECDKRDDALLT